jgi:hypothetical protein
MFRDFNIGINETKKSEQPRISFVKDKKGNLLADSRSVLSGLGASLLLVMM